MDDLKPYPQIIDAENSPQTVLIIRELMSGKNSEQTAVHTYVFQEVTAENDGSIKDALEQIGLQEMEHFELLANAIVSFGGIPYFANTQREFWSARNVNYELDPKKYLKQNIKAEQEAISNYIVGASRVSNNSLKQLFYRIIQDEQRHIEIFEDLLKELN